MFLTTVNYQLSGLQIIHVTYRKIVQVWHRKCSTVSQTSSPPGIVSSLECSKKLEPKNHARSSLQQAKSGQVPPNLILKTRSAGEYTVAICPTCRLLSSRSFSESMQPHVNIWSWLSLVLR